MALLKKGDPVLVPVGDGYTRGTVVKDFGARVRVKLPAPAANPVPVVDKATLVVLDRLYPADTPPDTPPVADTPPVLTPALDGHDFDYFAQPAVTPAPTAPYPKAVLVDLKTKYTARLVGKAA